MCLQGERQIYRLAQNVSNQEIGIHKIDSKILAQILKVLNLQETEQFNEYLIRIKRKLVRIVFQENQHYLEYFSLPRFDCLSVQAREMLINMTQKIRQIVAQLSLQPKREQDAAQYQKFLPEINTFQEAQDFHLKFLNLYTDSSICPFKSSNCQSYINKPTFLPYSPQIYRPIFPRLSHQSFNSPNIWTEGLCFNPHIQQMQSQFLNAQRRKEILQNYSFNVPNNRDYQPHNTAKQAQALGQIGSSFLVSSDSAFSSEAGSQLSDQQFSRCPCMGRRNSSSYFFCIECDYKFHYSCLRISKNDNKQFSLLPCPICRIQTVNTLLFKLIRPSVVSSWAVLDRLRQFRIHFQPSVVESMSQAHARGAQIIFKIIRVKDFKNLEQTDMQDQILQDQRSCGEFRSEALISENTLELIGCMEDPFLDLGSIKNTFPEDQPSSLFYWSFYIVKRKLMKQIIQESKQNDDEIEYFSFLKEYCLTNKEKSVTIKIALDENYVPVRGQKCKHPQCLNLIEFCQQKYEQLKDQPSRQIYCPICESQIEQYKIDFQIWNFLKENDSSQIQTQQKILLCYEADKDILAMVKSQQSPRNLKEITRSSKKIKQTD